MRVAVSGANGFIGSHIVRRLRKSSYDVLSLVRSKSDLTSLRSYSNTVRVIDYHSDFSEELRGVDVFVHNAARAKDYGHWREFEEDTLLLTERILNMVKKSNIKKLIYISSIAVMGEEDSLLPKDESSPYNPKLPYLFEEQFPSAMNYYRIAKARAEQCVRAFCREHEISLIVLRPAWVYGEREFHAGTFEYIKTVQSGGFLMPGSPSSLFHLVYVGDLAQAVERSLSRFQKKEEVFIIGNPDVPKMVEFNFDLLDRLGIKRPIILKSFLLLPFVLFLEFLWCFFKIESAPLLTRARLYMFYANNVYNVNRSLVELKMKYTPHKKAKRGLVYWWKLYRYF